MLDLEERDVVVVGASGALGQALVEAFSSAGSHVCGLDHQPPTHPMPRVDYSEADVQSDGSLAAWFDERPVPWAVVNTVGGYAPPSPLGELDVDELMQQLNLNLVTAALVTKYALRRMAQARDGRLIHTASRAAFGVDDSGFAYSVSKKGVLHLVEMAARETHGTGITVNAVVPSVLDTPANRAAMPTAEHSRWPQLGDVAAVYRFLAAPDARLISGAAIPVYGLA